MPPSVLFKQAFIWGVGATVGSLATQGVTKGVATLTKKVFKKNQKSTTET